MPPGRMPRPAVPAVCSWRRQRAICQDRPSTNASVISATRRFTPTGYACPERPANKELHMDHLVLTVIAQDQPGLVERIAQCISEHGGNWLESRMSRMAGQFAGILRVDVPLDAHSG